MAAGTFDGPASFDIRNHLVIENYPMARTFFPISISHSSSMPIPLRLSASGLHRRSLLGLLATLLGVATLLVGVGSVPALAQAPPNPPRPPLLVVEDGGVRQRRRPDMAELNFGQLDRRQQRFVRQTFRLRNQTSTPITLTNVDVNLPKLGSLGLSVDIVPKGVGRVLPIIAPGREVLVQVELDLTAVPPGPVLKGVQIYALGQSEPIATLFLTGLRRSEP